MTLAPFFWPKIFQTCICMYIFTSSKYSKYSPVTKRFLFFSSWNCGLLLGPCSVSWKYDATPRSQAHWRHSWAGTWNKVTTGDHMLRLHLPILEATLTKYLSTVKLQDIIISIYIISIIIYIVIGINTGNAKLKTPQISHAPAVFPQTAQRQDPMLPVAAAKTRMVLRKPSWKAVHGKRMTGHSQMAPSGFRSTPTSGCLSLNRLQCMATCLKDLQRNWTKTGILCGFTLPKEVSKL